MDILVLIMLALFLMVIAFVVIIYVIVRKNSSDKMFNKKRENDILEFDDDDDDDFNISIPLPSTLQKVVEENHDEIKIEPFKQEIEEKEEVIDDELLNNNDNDKDEVLIEEEIIDEEQEQNNELELSKVEENDTSLNEDIMIKQEKLEEVVNVLINKRNYIFLANNNIVSKNDRLKVVIDNKIYFGVVTKANYIRDINLMKIKPRKLIIVKNKPKKILEEEFIKESKVNEEIEFIPRKKKKD